MHPLMIFFKKKRNYCELGVFSYILCELGLFSYILGFTSWHVAPLYALFSFFAASINSGFFFMNYRNYSSPHSEIENLFMVVQVAIMDFAIIIDHW